MESCLLFLARYVALALEMLVVVTVGLGAAGTVVGVTRYFLRHERAEVGRRAIWLGFARWLLLALEFALGADIVRTAIAPTWDQLGQLGLVALIRTVLGAFLERDIRELGARKADDAEA